MSNDNTIANTLAAALPVVEDREELEVKSFITRATEMSIPDEVILPVPEANEMIQNSP